MLFRGSMDARVGDCCFPLEQVFILCLQTVECLPFERVLLPIFDATFNLPFVSGHSWFGRQDRHAVVLSERVEFLGFSSGSYQSALETAAFRLSMTSVFGTPPKC